MVGGERDRDRDTERGGGGAERKGEREGVVMKEGREVE